MYYQVPDDGHDPKTGRVNCIVLKAEIAAEELFFTKLEEVFEKGTGNKLILIDEEDNALILNFDEREDG